MSIRIEGEVIHLGTRSMAEDADDLLRALQEMPGATVEIGTTTLLHMAVMQVLLALRPAIHGRPVAGLLSRSIFRRLISEEDTALKTS
jgi:hypothetical protein